jgi:hypothetical protein
MFWCRDSSRTANVRLAAITVRRMMTYSTPRSWHELQPVSQGAMEWLLDSIQWDKAVHSPGAAVFALALLQGVCVVTPAKSTAVGGTSPLRAADLERLCAAALALVDPGISPGNGFEVAVADAVVWDCSARTAVACKAALPPSVSSSAVELWCKAAVAVHRSPPQPQQPSVHAPWSAPHCAPALDTAERLMTASYSPAATLSLHHLAQRQRALMGFVVDLFCPSDSRASGTGAGAGGAPFSSNASSGGVPVSSSTAALLFGEACIASAVRLALMGMVQSDADVRLAAVDAGVAVCSAVAACSNPAGPLHNGSGINTDVGQAVGALQACVGRLFQVRRCCDVLGVSVDTVAVCATCM